MIDDLKPYPEYKDSGLPWLAKVPAHWRVVRNGNLFRQRNQTGFAELPILEVSLRTGVRVRDFEKSKRKQVMSDFAKYKRAAAGDIAYNMMRLWQGAVGIAPVDGLVSPAYVVAAPFDGVEPRYFNELFRTAAYMAEVDNSSRGIVKDRNRLYWDQFKTLMSPCPPPDEQAAIVRFLGWATGQVDRAILAKRKVIALLNEQKQVIIDRAVTGAQNMSAAQMPVNSPFLHSIPGHWEWVRFKNRIGFQEGPGIMLADFREQGVPLLRISCLAGPEATLEGCNYLSRSKVREKWSHFAVRDGDYLLSASGSTGAVKKASDVVFGAIPYTGIIRLWAKTSSTDMEYIKYFMMSGPFRDQISLAKAGVGIEHFGPTHLKRMWICHPPLDEQKCIAKEIESATKGMDLSISRFDRQIELLREYRNRLIADSVQGQHDVRKVTLALPEIVGDREAQISVYEQDPSIELDEALP